MNIANVSNQAVVSNQRTASDSDDAVRLRNSVANGQSADEANQFGRDEVSISAESVELARTAVVSSVSNQTQISDQREAGRLARTAVNDIQNNPEQARNAFANVLPSNASRLLTERIVAG